LGAGDDIAAIAHLGSIERHPAHSERGAGISEQERDPAQRSTSESPALTTLAYFP
jgi:hypothetical protein